MHEYKIFTFNVICQCVVRFLPVKSQLHKNTQQRLIGYAQPALLQLFRYFFHSCRCLISEFARSIVTKLRHIVAQRLSCSISIFVDMDFLVPLQTQHFMRYIFVTKLSELPICRKKREFHLVLSRA